MKIKEILNKLTYKEIALGVIAILILFMFVWGVSDSHAFYNNETKTIPLINATVGNFLNKTEGNIDKTSDVNLMFYVQTQDDLTNYMLVEGIPQTGFKVNTTKSNCTPNDNTATYTIDIDGTVTLTSTETVPKQVVCRIFYDKVADSDVIIYALIQDDQYGTVLYNNKRYSYLAELPDLSSYTLAKKCTQSDTSISYDVTNGITYISSKPDVCYAFFSRK